MVSDPECKELLTGCFKQLLGTTDFLYRCLPQELNNATCSFSTTYPSLKKPDGSVLLAADKETEASLLQAHSEEALPHVELADSSRAWLGQRAYTFGNPFHVIEYDGQVASSVGVVSGIYTIEDNGEGEQSTYDGLVLETDAAVNPGASGGARVLGAAAAGGCAAGGAAAVGAGGWDGLLPAGGRGGGL